MGLDSNEYIFDGPPNVLVTNFPLGILDFQCLTHWTMLWRNFEEKVNRGGWRSVLLYLYSP